MTSRDFAYWLQGYFEIHGKADSLTPEQVEMIKRHLALVFQHEIDPSFGDEQVQQMLNNMHDPSLKHPRSTNPKVRC
jgi:hypothetical protein